MKKILCLVLSAMLVLGLAACGGSDEPKMPDFSEEALTEAQNYVKTAMAYYEIPDKEEDFKDAYVMTTDDLAKDLAGKVDISKWDLSEIEAAVVVFLGDKETETTTEDSSKKKKSKETEAATSEESLEKANDWSRVVFLIGGEDHKVKYYKSLKESSTATAESALAAEEEVATGSSGNDITDAKKSLAQALLDTENYLATNAEVLGDYPTLLAEKITANPDYLYSLEYYTDGLAGTENAYQKGFYAGHLRNEYRAQYVLDQLQAENPKDKDLIEEDYLWFDEVSNILFEMSKIHNTIASLEANSADALIDYKAALEAVKDKPDYFFEESVARAALANEAANSYDNCLRQLEVYQTTLDAIYQIMASSDEDEREYLQERGELVDAQMADYSNLFKTYVQCILNLENFEATNAEAMAAYEAELAAVKEAVGDGYKDSVEYMKVELKYQDMNNSHAGFKNAIPLAKADLDAMKAEHDEKLAELDAENQERLDEIVIKEEQAAFYEYMKTVTAEVSEYEAAKGQFGYVHPDYKTYQNQHLTYYTYKSSGSSSGSSYKGSYSSGNSASYGDDSDWANYDYDGDGEINGSEFEAGFNDAIEQMYNEMMGY